MAYQQMGVQPAGPGYRVGIGLQPTSPASTYTAPGSVNFGYNVQPVTRPSMGYTPGGTLGGFGIPGQRPTAPSPVAAGTSVQQPTSSMPSLAPAAGGALAGANGLAGAPGGYSAMPGGFSGTAPGLLGTPDTRKIDAYREYDPINLGTVGGLLATGAGMAVPGLGLLNTARNVYNTEETAAYDSKIGADTGFFDRVLGYLGLNSYGAGSISADGKSYAMGSPSQNNPKSGDRGTPGGAGGQARGAAPAGSTSMGAAARSSTSRQL